MSSKRIPIALALGLLCHSIFLCSVALMAYSLFWGLAYPLIPITAPHPFITNALLIIQFPILHSFLLTPRGSKILTCLLPNNLREDLRTTMFALVSSIQLLAVFLCWRPLSTLVLKSEGTLWHIQIFLYLLSWIFLIKAISDAGASVQTGFIGWSSVVRKKKPVYPGMPAQGLFKLVRQPIYLGFFLVILTAPVWTLDHVIITIIWGAYCFIGPIFKEKRFTHWFGTEFENYRKHVPYFFPFSKRKKQ